MHLFFNDPRDGYVTRHRRIIRPSLAALVVGGVGVGALGVIVGAAGYDGGSGPPPTVGAQRGGFATPVATFGVADGGPLGMSTVPAAPQPILDLGVVPGPPAAGAAAVPATGEKKAVVRVERSRPRPKAAGTTAPAPVVTQEPVEEPVEVPAPVVEPPEEPAEPDEEPAPEPLQRPAADEHQGWHRWNPLSDGDGHRWRPFWEPR